MVCCPAQRIKRLPPYLFGKLNALKLAKRQSGVDIIDLGMGNPSDPAPQIVIDKLCEAAQDPRNHRYSASKGIKNLRGEIAKKYERKWNVQLDPETEVLACIGSKEGFSHLCLAMMGPGDTAIVPDPAFECRIGALRQRREVHQQRHDGPGEYVSEAKTADSQLSAQSDGNDRR